MMDKGDELHIFDLDGTLTKRDTFLPFLTGLLIRHPRKLIHSPNLLFAAVRYYQDKISNETLKKIYLSRITGSLRNQDIHAWAQRHASEILKQYIRRDALAKLSVLKKTNRRIILATASPDIYVNYIAATLQIDNVICTITEIKITGYNSGKMVGKNCYGKKNIRG